MVDRYLLNEVETTEIKRKLQEEEQFASIMENNLVADWESMPLHMKFKVVDIWTLVIMIGNFCHGLSALMMILPKSFAVTSHTVPDQIFGVGTFLLWLSLTMYL